MIPHKYAALYANSITAIGFDGGLVLVNSDRNQLSVYDKGAAQLWYALADGLPVDLLLDRIEADAGIAARRAAAEFVDGLTATETAAPTAETKAEVPPPSRGAVRWKAAVPGAVIELEAPDALLAQRLQEILPFDHDANGEPRARLRVAPVGPDFALMQDEIEILRTPEPNLLQGRIYQACLELLHDRPHWQALIHGAAVALDGRAIGFPARSGSGKSTLSAWLAAQGFAYLSDDLLAVLADGRVAPWATPVSVKPGSQDLLAKVYPQLPAGKIRLSGGVKSRLLPLAASQCAPAPVPLHALVFPTYDPQGDGKLHPLAPLEALARLASDRLWIGYPLQPDRVATFLEWLETIPAYGLRFASLDTAHVAIRDMLAREDG